MFYRVGSKIMTLATYITWIGIASSVIAGLGFMFSGLFLYALLIAVVGSLSAWIGSWVLYGFGSIIENQEIMVTLLRKAQKNNDFSKAKSSDATSYNHHKSLTKSNSIDTPNAIYEEKNSANTTQLTEKEKAIKLVQNALMYQTNAGIKSTLIERKVDGKKVQYKPLDDFIEFMNNFDSSNMSEFLKNFLIELQKEK